MASLNMAVRPHRRGLIKTAAEILAEIGRHEDEILAALIASGKPRCVAGQGGEDWCVYEGRTQRLCGGHYRRWLRRGDQEKRPWDSPLLKGRGRPPGEPRR